MTSFSLTGRLITSMDVSEPSSSSEKDDKSASSCRIEWVNTVMASNIYDVNYESIPSTVTRAQGKNCLYVGLCRSKEHRNLFLPENPFVKVFQHGEHEFESTSVRDLLEKRYNSISFVRIRTASDECGSLLQNFTRLQEVLSDEKCLCPYGWMKWSKETVL